jgi:hypothetical protein
MTARQAFTAFPARIDRQWDGDIVAQLVDYIRLPAKSPHFDPDWKKHGHIDAAVEQARRWVEAQRIEGMKLEVIRLAERTPVLFFDVPARGKGASSNSVLLYGHLDKQPEMTGWRQGFGPWTPVIEEGRLYGRGGADDGYAVFAAIAAIKAIDAEGIARPPLHRAHRDLRGERQLRPACIPRCPRAAHGRGGPRDRARFGRRQLRPALGRPRRLRGLVNGTLRVDILTEGVHSGDAGGVVPSSFRIARQLLDRIDDSRTGAVWMPRSSATFPPIASRRRSRPRHPRRIAVEALPVELLRR